MNDPNDSAYTIDELAAVSGVPSRTIRFYQSKGALPPPVRRGRKAYYDSTHVKRLELIAKLQDRGLQIRAIRNLCDQLHSGQASLEDWLGVEAQLRAPWSGDAPQLLDEAKMREQLKDRPPGVLAALLKADMVERQAGHYLVRSPSLLKIALTLEAHGIDVATAKEAGEILSRHLSRAATELSLYVGETVHSHLMEQGGPEQVGQLLEVLRPLALDAASLIFAREMQRTLEERLAEGRFGPSGSTRPKRGGIKKD